MTTPLKKRFYSLAWRVGMMTLAFLVEAIADNLGILELPPQATVFLGLILGEISKHLNNYVQFRKEINSL